MKFKIGDFIIWKGYIGSKYPRIHQIIGEGYQFERGIRYDGYIMKDIVGGREFYSEQQNKRLERTDNVDERYVLVKNYKHLMDRYAEYLI